jgi:ABC-type multidrug transport system permease subunit
MHSHSSQPTSGLDAAAAFHVMSVVHQLCTVKHRTIIAVIHQPAGEVFELFDTLTLLADGYPVYVGPASGAIDFYEAAGFPRPELRSAPDHLLHTVNADFDPTARDNIKALADAYASSPTCAAVVLGVDESHAEAMQKYGVDTKAPSAWRQTLVLTERAMLNNKRDPIIFWLRCAMFIMLCLCVGFIFFQLGKDWKDVYSRMSLLFFTTAFLTFMSISGFPAFMEDMKVFMRERLNGYYTVTSFVAANTLSSIPFLLIISVASALPVYWLSALNAEAGRFFYFIFNLFMALFVTESMMMAMAPLVPHFLVGIAGGAGILGLDMLVCGFFQPAGQLPRPVFFYPLHFLSFETYAFYGFVTNEFSGTSGWGCPCSAMEGGCPPALGGPECAMQGSDMLKYWDVPRWNKWCGRARRGDIRRRRKCRFVTAADAPARPQVCVDRGAGSVYHLLPPVLLHCLQVQGERVTLMRLRAEAATKTCVR